MSILTIEEMLIDLDQHPHDDAKVLITADFLEEHNNPLGAEALRCLSLGKWRPFKTPYRPAFWCSSIGPTMIDREFWYNPEDRFRLPIPYPSNKELTYPYVDPFDTPAYVSFISYWKRSSPKERQRLMKEAIKQEDILKAAAEQRQRERQKR